MLDKLKSIADLPTQKKLTYLTAIVIFSLSSVVIYYENQSRKKDELHRNDINEFTTRHAAAIAGWEAKLEACNQARIIDTQQSKEEYREMLEDIKKQIKD